MGANYPLISCYTLVTIAAYGLIAKNYMINPHPVKSHNSRIRGQSIPFLQSPAYVSLYCLSPYSQLCKYYSLKIRGQTVPLYLVLLLTGSISRWNCQSSNLALWYLRAHLTLSNPRHLTSQLACCHMHMCRQKLISYASV